MAAKKSGHQGPKGEELQWRLAGAIGAAAAAFVARKSLTTLWEVAVGKEPPANPESPDTTWKEAVAWAVVSGIVLGVARLLAERQAAKVWHKRKGTLPPGLETVA